MDEDSHTTQRFFLGKDDRLKSRKAIDALFKTGKSFSHFPFRVLWLLEDNNTGLKAGFTASTKNFKHATDRNRIKRLMREAYRLQKNTLAQSSILEQKALHLFFVYTGKDLPEYALTFEKIGGALKRIIKLIHEPIQ